MSPPVASDRTTGWTGGQYSLFRILFGAYLFVHFVQLAPWAAELFSNRGVLADGRHSPLLTLFPNVLALFDGPLFVTAMAWGAAALALIFLLGWHDRIAAFGLWYVQACFLGRDPLILNPAIPFVGWLLLAHLFVPPAPYGSWAARGRDDPDGGWRMPGGIWAAAWIVMALGYTYSGYTKLVSPSWIDGSALALVLDNPLARSGPVRELLLALPGWTLKLATWGALGLELAFAPLALLRKLRPWLWLAMLGMHLGLILVIDFADLSLGMVVLQLFTFNPAWIRPRAAGSVARVFYDGRCGLCHRAVRFLVAEDVDGRALRYAPLDSDAFRAAVPEAPRESMPDSIAMLSESGALLTRSSAVLLAAERLGGAWRVLGTSARLVPRVVRDAAYDLIASIRHRLFRKPDAACPILPPKLRARFDL